MPFSITGFHDFTPFSQISRTQVAVPRLLQCLTLTISNPVANSQQLLNLLYLILNWCTGQSADRCIPLFSPQAAHMHPPPMPGQGPPLGPPGAMSADAPGPTESMPINRMNEMYMQQKQGVSDRLEADGRGYDSVFSQ